MSKYTVENSDLEIIGTFSSLAKAHKAVQEFFQNGTEESLSEIRASLKYRSMTSVADSTFGVTCWIEKS
jgi:hypothetical protein